MARRPQSLMRWTVRSSLRYRYLVVVLGALIALWPSPDARRRRVTSLYAARLGRELSRA